VRLRLLISVMCGHTGDALPPGTKPKAPGERRPGGLVLW